MRAGSIYCPQCGQRMSDAEAAPVRELDVEAAPPREDSKQTPLTGEAVRETFQTWEAATSSPDLKPSSATASERESRGFAPPAPDDNSQENSPAQSRERVSQESTTSASRRLDAGTHAPERDVAAPAKSESPVSQSNVVEPRTETATAKRRRTAVIMEENVRPRVEKLREASMGVLEDASEDSGLRFVLVALALFLLALLFIFLMELFQ
ncbi:MAG TPA: hypothetical protein VNA19_17000 [Pyrinomonadaceae bacterium]|nr:hypothetical protein [Pyrinomonadaceae bacterium]